MTAYMRVRTRAATLVASETGLLVMAIALATVVRFGVTGARAVFASPDQLLKVVFIAIVCQLCLYVTDLYDLRLIANRGELWARTLRALSATSVLLAAIYFLFPALVVGRGVFAIAALLVPALVAMWRIAFEWIARRAPDCERLLIVGTGPSAVAAARELHERRLQLGIEIAGFIDPDPARTGTSVFNPRILGTPADLPTVVRTAGIDRVVVSLADARGQLPMQQLLDMKCSGVAFDHLTTVYERYLGKIAVDQVRPSALIFSPGFRNTTPLVAMKRALDIVLSLALLALAAPVMALVAIVIRLTSSGPVLYHQARVGRGGAIFTLHKFRSMRVDAEAETGAVWASLDDPRVTRIGRFLRSTRIDELPQLWNVLRGDMSVVGPRPERPEFTELLAERSPYFRQRQVVKPGLTGWAQVRYPYAASVEDALEKLEYDLFYIKYRSISRDVLIIFETIKTVLLRRGT